MKNENLLANVLNLSL